MSEKVENVQDYFGNKIILRRSVEQNLIYDTKKFRTQIDSKSKSFNKKPPLTDQTQKPQSKNYIRENRLNLL